MIIKKSDKDLTIYLDKIKIFLDPNKPKEDNINILSDYQKNLNTNKFFNLPGEYEIQGLQFNSYLNNKKLIFVFGYHNIKFLYLTEEPKDDLINHIFNEWGEIDIIIIDAKLNNLPKIKNKLKFKIIIDVDNKNNLKGEKAKEIKINPKKIEEKSFIIV